MKKKLNIIFLPKWDEANPYQRLLSDGLRNNGCRVTIENYSKSLFPLLPVVLKHRRKKEKNIIHLHWLSEVLLRTGWSKKAYIYWFKYCCLALDLLICRFLGFKLIWTIHNKLAHEGVNKNKEIQLRRLFFRLSNHSLVHSEEAIDILESLYSVKMREKTSVVEHGSYIGVYPQPSGSVDKLRDFYSIPADEKVFLYFGSIKPYKGVEEFINLARLVKNDPSMFFVIAGEVGDINYKQVLNEKINSKNILVDFNFLDDQKMIDYISLSDAVILPFAETLTSGTVLLAMSEGKAVILPKKGKVFGCFDKEYPLFYTDTAGLKNIVCNYEKFIFKKIGFNNLVLAKKRNWNKIGSDVHKLYLSL